MQSGTARRRSQSSAGARQKRNESGAGERRRTGRGRPRSKGQNPASRHRRLTRSSSSDATEYDTGSEEGTLSPASTDPPTEEEESPPTAKRARARGARKHGQQVRVNFLDLTEVPIRSRQPTPPRGLKLPTVSSAALHALADRTKVVSVDEVVHPHAQTSDNHRGQTPRYPPLNPAAYMRGVTAIALYRTYFFPATAIQWTSYLLWLQGRAGNLGTAALRDLDVQARTHIARYGHEYHDPASLNEAVGHTLATDYTAAAAAPGPMGTQPTPAPRRTSSGNERCHRFNFSRCHGHCGREHTCVICPGAERHAAASTDCPRNRQPQQPRHLPTPSRFPAPRRQPPHQTTAGPHRQYW